MELLNKSYLMKPQFRHMRKERKQKTPSNCIENIYEFTFLMHTIASLSSKLRSSHPWEQKYRQRLEKVSFPEESS